MFLYVLYEFFVMLKWSGNGKIIFVHSWYFFHFISEHEKHLKSIQGSYWYTKYCYFASKFFFVQVYALVVNTKFKESLVWSKWIIFITCNPKIYAFQNNTNIKVNILKMFINSLYFLNQTKLFIPSFLLYLRLRFCFFFFQIKFFLIVPNSYLIDI